MVTMAKSRVRGMTLEVRLSDEKGQPGETARKSSPGWASSACKGPEVAGARPVGVGPEAGAGWQWGQGGGVREEPGGGQQGTGPVWQQWEAPAAGETGPRGRGGVLRL